MTVALASNRLARSGQKRSPARARVPQLVLDQHFGLQAMVRLSMAREQGYRRPGPSPRASSVSEGGEVSDVDLIALVYGVGNVDQVCRDPHCRTWRLFKFW